MKNMKDSTKSFIIDISIVLFILIIAGIVRLISLETTPPGFHGDEAYTAQDAKRILENGFIEPYTGNALGQPTGPLYVTALVIRLFGYSISSVRASMALFGVASVVLFYIFNRLFFNKTIALLSTGALGLSLYHIHFSRIAFMLNAAPFFQLLSLIFLVLARRRIHKWHWYFLTGLMAGIGIHSYNTFVIFPPIVFLLLFYDVVVSKWQKEKLIGMAVFSISFVIGGFPLLHYMFFHLNDYLQHHRTYAVLNHYEYASSHNALSQFEFIIRNGTQNIKNFYLGNKIDAVDAYGQTYSFHLIHLALAFMALITVILPKKILGVAYTEKAKEIFFYARFAIIGLIIIHLSAYLTFDAFYRRQILALVFLYFLISVGIYALYIVTRHRNGFMLIALTVLLIYGAFSDITTYFKTTGISGSSHWVFASEISSAGKWIVEKAPDSALIGLYSDRWDCNFPSFIFHIGQKKCISMNHPDAIKLETLPKNNVVFVLLGNYMEKYPEIVRQFPLGETHSISSDYSSQKTTGLVYIVQ